VHAFRPWTSGRPPRLTSPAHTTSLPWFRLLIEMVITGGAAVSAFPSISGITDSAAISAGRFHPYALREFFAQNRDLSSITSVASTAPFSPFAAGSTLSAVARTIPGGSVRSSGAGGTDSALAALLSLRASATV
jgi:hypothetical protein